MTNPGEAPNPLLEAKIDSLDRIFSDDPLNLTIADRAAAVAALRKQRATWAIAEAEGKTRAPKAKATATGPKPTLTLSDLDD